jgi:hypothetical protein
MTGLRSAVWLPTFDDMADPAVVAGRRAARAGTVRPILTSGRDSGRGPGPAPGCRARI